MRTTQRARAGRRAMRYGPREMGYLLLVVGLPLVITPFTTAPLVDGKIVLLTLGTLLVAASRPRLDRTLAIAAGAWVGATLLAAVLGLDPLWSLVGTDKQAMGVIAVTAGGYLLAAGPAVDGRLLERLPAWVFWAGTLMATVAVLGRFIAVSESPNEFGGLSSYIGHRVFVAGLIGAAILAATAVERTTARTLALVVCGSGLAVTAARSSWIGVVVGVGLWLFIASDRRRQVLWVLAPVVLALAGWTLADSVLPEQHIEFSAAPRFTQIEEGSAAERPAVWAANLRAWGDRPVLGSGPGTGWHNFLAYATPEEVRSSDRTYGDAHNLFIETAATSGVLGLGTLLALVVLVALKIRRATPERAWAAGAAAVLAVVHLLQPNNIRLTPLMFLLAGVAIPPSAGRRLATPVWSIVVLALGAVLALMRFTGSYLEAYGITYASTSALDAARVLDPSRVSPLFELARIRAFEHRTGDTEAATDTIELLDRMVERQPWNPGVRIRAANLAPAVDGEDRAMTYLTEHLERFPNDPLALAGVAVLQLRDGDRDAARTAARRALDLDPGLNTAADVLAQLDSQPQPRPDGARTGEESDEGPRR